LESINNVNLNLYEKDAEENSPKYWRLCCASESCMKFNKIKIVVSDVDVLAPVNNVDYVVECV
jgi:hypothetical protein